jgi:SAM-dependent methyltransferase
VPRTTADIPYEAFAVAYDRALGERFFAALAPMLDDAIDRHGLAGGRHLDLACGTALAIPHLEARGFRSTGVDFSMAMLRQARTRSSLLVAGDLRRLPLSGLFDVLTCLYDSLNHLLEPQELTLAFRSIRSVMGERSLLLFDMNHPDIYPAVWGTKEPYVASGPDYLLRMHTRFDKRAGIGTAVVTGWSRKPGGGRIEIEEVHRQRSYDETAIRACLRAGGIEVIEVIGFDPFDELKTLRARGVKMFFVCRAM